MEGDAFPFYCGSVPLLLLYGPKGPGGPWQFVQILIGCFGGWAAYRLFGDTLAPDGGALPLFLIGVAGGALFGQLAAVTIDTFRGRAEISPRV